MDFRLPSERRPQQGYSWPVVVLAAIATPLVPLITLITALVLLEGEPFEPKRRILKAWAWVSLALVTLIATFILFVLISLNASFG